MTTPAPPTLTSPPTPPSRSDPANFAARGDAFMAWFPTAWTQLTAAMQWISARTSEVFANSMAATQAANTVSTIAASPAVQNAAANAAAAQLAATQAQTYASQAQATNPDSPIRINPTRVMANFTLPTGYNGASAGPISIDDGVTVTISNGATWSIH
jgi:hypothetical protein